MISRRFLVVSAAIAIAACAGVAFALPRTEHSPPPKPRTTHVAPTATPVATLARTTAGPSNGQHASSGPAPVVERHVIHSTGPVAIVSGTVTNGTSTHGAVGTPKPSP